MLGLYVSGAHSSVVSSTHNPGDEHLELIGVKEIAEMAGVSSAAVANWRKRHDDFPVPVQEMGSGPVFERDTVLQWLQRRQKPVKPLGLEDALWKAADKLRGSMDASEYKHIVLGLIFLKYVEDAFEERRSALKEELAADGVTGTARGSTRKRDPIDRFRGAPSPRARSLR